MPLRRPSTMCRARISNRPIRLITSGCKDLLEALVMDQLVFVGGCDIEQSVDNLVRGNAIAFGGEIDDQAMSQHGLGQRADVLQRDVWTAVDERAGLGPQYEEL